MSVTRPQNAPLWIWVAVPAYLLLHGVIATCLPPRLDPLSTFCIVLAEWAAIIVALRAARQERPARPLWFLLAGAVLIHSVAMSLDVVAEITNAPAFNFVPAFQIFFSMLQGVPLLIAVSLQSDRRTIKEARIIHSLLSFAIGIVLYLEIFSILTVKGSQNPADAVLITRLFDGIDFFLAAAATLRWLGSQLPQECAFFRTLFIFLWIDAVLPAIHNRIIVRHDYVWLDLFISAPYAILVVLILRSPERSTSASLTMARVIRSASPIFLAMALIAIGIFALPLHFYVGLSAVLFAIAGYGALNVLIQTRGLETEAALLEDKRKLERLVLVDSLTSIANRREFDLALRREFAAARRAKSPLSVLLIDVDHFKQVNDHWGHPVGDEYLVRIAEALRSALPRVTDSVARYGGEEFTAILPSTAAAGAVQAGERLHQAVHDLGLPHPTAPSRVVSISIGISTYDGLAQISPSRLIKTADRAMYLAKSRGRNRSEFLAPEARA